ncbi:uncharacterized protein [Malus domestica]|uniref:uncharacterized protein isoform X3 n=1 Tax=Malus domestica TaxID=3750 RepID=UPI0039750500
MREEKRHQLMQNLFGDQSEEEEEEVDSEHESNPQPDSDYNNKMAQLRAGKSSKSKLTIVKFKTLESVDGWEVRQGTYFGSDPRPVNACVQRIVMAARSCRSGKLF